MTLRICSAPRGTLVWAVLLALSVVAATEARAATFPNLYRVTVTPDPAVADRRAEAIRLALSRLLIRVTGDRNAGLDPELASLLGDPARYLNSYGLDLQGQAVVGFNASLVDQALTALDRPVWGPERPLTLVWIAVDDGLGGRAMLPANELGTEQSAELTELLAAVRAELLAVADERGLPLALPLLDLEDLTAVSFADVWGGFDDRIALASVRYRPDSILVGRVRPGVLGNEVQWLLLKDGTRRVLGGVALRDGLDAVADAYAAELSVSGGATSARLTVLDVAAPADYGRVISHLEGLSVLQSVDVESLESGVLTLRVTARGDARVLERVLALGGVLSPLTSPVGATRSDQGLAFRVARPASAP
jgi:hypothetical protein